MNLKIETKNAPEPEEVELKAALDDLTRSVEEKSQAAADAALKTARDEIKGLRTEIAALKRPGTGQADDEVKPEVKAFWSFIRSGAEQVDPEERKSLVVAEDTRGGYLAPDAFEAQIQKELVEISPIRAAARVTQTTAGRVTWPKRSGTITAHWVDETEERQETQPSYGMAAIDVAEMAAYVDVSNWLLEDSAVDLASELAGDFAEEFGRLEAEAFILGDGVKKPFGLLNDESVETLPNGHAANLSADALIALQYSLPAYYRNRGAWMMNAQTLAKVRTLKDGQNNYLWQPSYQAGQPETLLGRPVIEAVDFPAIAENQTPIAYGDFAAGYRIVDRVGLSILRDPFTQATRGMVRFHGRRRVGGGVTRPEAFRKLKMAVS